jgi:hypothetical protein
MQTRDGHQTTIEGGIQIITSPDRATTTIVDNGRITTINVSQTGLVTATVNGKAVAPQSSAVSDAIGRIAAATQRATPRVWRGGEVRVNGHRLTPDELLAGTAAVSSAATLVALIVLYTLGRFVRRLVRRAPAPAALQPAAPSVAPRIERLEQAIESIAVEMERVAEAQRYSARLLTERLPEAPASAVRRGVAPERVVTPH